MSDDLIGVVLDGRYRIVERLAEGGFGTVWVARQLNIDRDVAIKVMRREGGEEQLSRFEREARIISELRHPNTLKLIDYGKTPEGMPYLVTELLSGRPLSKVLESGPLDVLFTLEIIEEVCGSLNEGHAKGVVHRDLKPANIFLESVGGEDVVKVLDFGVAKVPSASATMSGVIVGTPAYMSPEIVDARPIDGRSDIYSLGVVAYECLTGRLPFEGTAIAQIAAHGMERAKPPSEIGVSLDPRVESLVMRMLSKDAGDRPSAAALAREVDELLLDLRGPRQRVGTVLIALGIALAIGVMIAALGFPPEQESAGAAIIDAAAVDAGFDFGSEGVRATPEVEGWEEPEAALDVLRGMTPVLLECYGLLDDPRPVVTVQFDAAHSGTTIAVLPPEAARVRECFAFRHGKRIEWPGVGRASILLSPRE